MASAASLIRRWEDLLSSLFEGSLERLFRVRVQPVHIARRLELAMEDGAVVGPDGLIAPNRYTVALDPAAHARFAAAVPGLQRDLSRHLAEVARGRRMRFLDPVVIEIHCDQSLRSERFRIAASFNSAAEPTVRRRDRGTAAASSQEAGPAHQAQHGSPPAPGREPTMPMAVLRPAAATAAAVLEVRPPDSPVRMVSIAGDRCTIGRAGDNDVVLDDASVSRHHARLDRGSHGYVIEDTGSTNGLLVNGKDVRRALLRDGDRIVIGQSHLIFRQH